MNFLIRTCLSLSLCVSFFVSANQLYGQVTYSISGAFGFNNFPQSLTGERFVAEFEIDLSAPDTDPSLDRGEYPNAIVSATIEFESGIVSEIDFSGGVVTILRDSGGGGIFLQDASQGSTFLIYDLGNPFDSDALVADPETQFTASPDSLIALDEPELGLVFSFGEVDLGEEVVPMVFAVIAPQTDSVVLGDCNLDGAVTFEDIPAMIQTLRGGDYLEQADCNEDREVNFADIPSFIGFLMGAGSAS